MDSKQDMKEELRSLVRGLKTHIVSGMDSPGGFSNLYLKGKDLSVKSVDKPVTLEDIRKKLGGLSKMFSAPGEE
ncbi:unnamed protein product [marine sediment metagenome]|uniref:Uncharacterized protein n=1 Tax=marine sediment metagenome TaxID=412755 RepID=X1TP57_9ZZZZ